jgi:predicted enzyme related to lactoylglutathione lyase
MAWKQPQNSLKALCLASALIFTTFTAQADTPKPVAPGEFIWHDLITSNPSAAEKFYPAVFGWTMTAAADNSYSIKLNNVEIGNMYLWPAKEPQKVQAEWISAIASKNSTSTEKQITKMGGTVLIPAKYIKGKGTQGVYRDAQGAVFAVLQSENNISTDAPVNDGDFFWQDLFTLDTTSASDYYQKLFGYEADQVEISENLSRVMLSTAGYARAGIAKMPELVKKPVWLPYILVEDVAGTVKKAVANGGKAVVEPQTSLLDGNLAVIADPQGAVIGLINWTQKDEGAQP